MWRPEQHSLLVLLALLPWGFANAQSACDERDRQVFAPLIGEWQEYVIPLDALAEVLEAGQIGDAQSSGAAERSRELSGRLSTRWVAGGCALEQKFQSANAQFSFQSLAWQTPAGQWHELYVDSQGGVNRYRWIENEEELILEQIGRPGPEQRRLVIFAISDNGYYVLDEQSVDRGMSWKQTELVHTVRQQAAPPAANVDSD